jgi:1-deoxy-D-xylulose-5-phosphate reductoisomerase
MPCILNAANEVAVGAFLAGKLSFLSIYDIIERTLDARENCQHPELETLFAEDSWARGYAQHLLQEIG